MIRQTDYHVNPRSHRGPRPTLGAMFRLIHSALVQEYTAWLASSNYLDVKPAHAAALQPLWQNPDGERLTTLADTASITNSQPVRWWIILNRRAMSSGSRIPTIAGRHSYV